MKRIPLTQGKFALVDDALFDELNKFKWCADKRRNTFYAIRRKRGVGGQVSCYMHREIFLLLGEPIPKQVDHWDTNGLNNQRENLRSATESQNKQNCHARSSNTSGYKGVYWHTKSEKWCAQAKLNGQNIYLGIWDTPEKAARAYDRFAYKHYGDFSRLNFPDTPGPCTCKLCRESN